jgi:CRP-like cAMP-binding protein
MGISERFKDESDLVAALLRQQVIANDRAIADDVAQVGELLEFEPGQRLIEQGAVDREIYFLLAGEARVIVNGVRMHTRGAGVTVGEMSALNSTIASSATIEPRLFIICSAEALDIAKCIALA